MIYIKIKVKSGIYRVRIPTGRAGALHFGILTKYMDDGQQEITLADKAAMEAGEPIEKKRMSPEMKTNMAEAFIEWSSKVLPQILVGFTKEGTTEEVPLKVDDVSGQDQYAIFMAMLEQLDVGDEFFRIIE